MQILNRQLNLNSALTLSTCWIPSLVLYMNKLNNLCMVIMKQLILSLRSVLTMYIQPFFFHHSFFVFLFIVFTSEEVHSSLFRRTGQESACLGSHGDFYGFYICLFVSCSFFWFFLSVGWMNLGSYPEKIPVLKNLIPKANSIKRCRRDL